MRYAALIILFCLLNMKCVQTLHICGDIGLNSLLLFQIIIILMKKNLKTSHESYWNRSMLHSQRGILFRVILMSYSSLTRNHSLASLVWSRMKRVQHWIQWILVQLSISFSPVLFLSIFYVKRLNWNCDCGKDEQTISMDLGKKWHRYVSICQNWRIWVTTSFECLHISSIGAPTFPCENSNISCQIFVYGKVNNSHIQEFKRWFRCDIFVWENHYHGHSLSKPCSKWYLTIFLKLIARSSIIDNINSIELPAPSKDC